MKLLITLLTVFTAFTASANSIPEYITNFAKMPQFSAVTAAETNTKYSEYVSGVFRNKIIVVSSKKIGGLGNGKDKNTNEPFTQLFCLDHKQNGDLSKPLLFSRILNTKHNEGHVAFSPDEHTIYFTRSKRDNSKNYQLYSATLERNSPGNWKNEKQLTENTDFSVENPHVSADGKRIYFASNKPGGFGGYDLYLANIKADGTIGTPINLGPKVNSDKDEKYPFLTKDGSQLYFSSNGHGTLGGFDVFVSFKYNEDLLAPENLGSVINTEEDEVSFMLSSNNRGYFSSNRTGGMGSYDVYRFNYSANTVASN